MGLFSPFDQEEELRRARALQLAQMTPDQRIAYTRIAGAQAGAAGVGDVLRAAAGAPSPAMHRRAAQAEIAQALQGLDSSDPDAVYPVVIRILQKHGLVDEALAMGKEYEDLRNKKQDRAIKEREVARKEAADAAKDRYYSERIALMRDKNAEPERLLEAYATTMAEVEQVTDPTERARLQALARGLAARLGVKPEKVGGEWQVKLGVDHMVRYNTNTGEVETVRLREPKPAGGSGGNAGPFTPVPGYVTAQGDQIYKDKNGKLYYPGPNGEFVPAQSAERDRSDTSAPADVRNAIAKVSVVKAQAEHILQLMNDPKASKYLGAQNYANNFFDMADRLQTEGVPLRAALADFASAVIHERSGGAVTASEFERLRPFVPKAEDSVRIAKAKMEQFANTAAMRLETLRRMAGTEGGRGEVYPRRPAAAPAPAQGAPAPSAPMSAPPAGGLPPGVIVRRKG